MGYTAQLAGEKEGWLLLVVVGTCLRPRNTPCCGSLGRKERGGTHGGRGPQRRPGQEGDHSSWHTSGMKGPAGVERTGHQLEYPHEDRSTRKLAYPFVSSMKDRAALESGQRTMQVRRTIPKRAHENGNAHHHLPDIAGWRHEMWFLIACMDHGWSGDNCWVSLGRRSVPCRRRNSSSRGRHLLFNACTLR